MVLHCRVIIIIVFLLGLVESVSGANRTFSTSGNWNLASKWTGSNIAQTITDNATLNSSRTATIVSTDSYTIGNLTPNSTSTLTIDAGGVLNVGASGTPKNVNGSAFDNITFNISGTLEVWGDFDLGDQGTLNILAGGILIVHGDFTAKNQTAATVEGTVTVGGTTKVGGQSTLAITSPGSWSTSSCIGPNGFCIKTAALPVTLLFFQAKMELDRIILDWSTASEFNFDYFDVQKSTNGESFSTLAKIPGHGTTHERNDYSLSDTNPSIGKNYYRLTSVDFDGYTETFKVIGVNYTAEKSFTIAPNPSSGGVINFSLNYIPEGEFIIAIYDNVGNVIDRFNTTNPEHQITYNKSLSSGTYYAKLIAVDFVKVERFIVQ